MSSGYTFKAVEAIARELPEVEVTTTWGQPTLKVSGMMFSAWPPRVRGFPSAVAQGRQRWAEALGPCAARRRRPRRR